MCLFKLFPKQIQFVSGPLCVFIVVAANYSAAEVRADDAEKSTKLIEAANKSFGSLTRLAEAARQDQNDDLVQLGRKLFFDPRFSADGVWSCMLCHQPSLHATDAQALSRGVFDKFLPRNAPTVLNSSLQFSIHWDGRFADVEEQAAHALMGPGFGNKNSEEAVKRITSIPGYAALFSKAFPRDADPVTTRNFGIAVGAYERTLLTPGRFDEFLDGKADALTAAEQKGLDLFMNLGCVNCHNKVNLGGEQYEKFGESLDYWTLTKSKVVDKGRYEITKKEEDMYVFKVAPLRNVEMSPPYFHDGSVVELSDAVKIMAKAQLDLDLTPDQNSAIVDFLKSLTAPLPPGFDNAPQLPPGAFRTIGE